MTEDESTETLIDQEQDEQPACAHEHAMMAMSYDLVNIMYELENKRKDQTSEEKLGFLVNSISGVIYAASQALMVESWIVFDGDKQTAVTPMIQAIPPKSKAN